MRTLVAPRGRCPWGNIQFGNWHSSRDLQELNGLALLVGCVPYYLSGISATVEPVVGLGDGGWEAADSDLRVSKRGSKHGSANGGRKRSRGWFLEQDLEDPFCSQFRIRRRRYKSIAVAVGVVVKHLFREPRQHRGCAARHYWYTLSVSFSDDVIV